jgi:dTDP-4-amino-4,6-dideoxygalactose transaminase
MINVTKTFLPSFDEYTSTLKKAWDNAWITNNGLLVQELELKLKEYLDVPNLWFCNNGTVVLQMALKALNITKEVITTPFSYVATTNAILWEGCTPVYVDINKDTYCIDADKIEQAITENTQAILATHVYGFPCDIEKIEAIAKKHNLKVIYDAAHAFGCEYKGKSLLAYGDITTCSFHATKLFHTVEGGCIICNDEELAKKLFLYRSFGHIGDDYYSLGINGKNSEMHAAMGLCVLPKMAELIDRRENIFSIYDQELNFKKISKPTFSGDFKYNFAYYPVVFESEEILLKVRKALLDAEVSTRRYFYPSLNKLPFVESKQCCCFSEGISERVLSLPIYFDLPTEDIIRISRIINGVI